VLLDLLPALRPLLEDGSCPKAAHDYKSLLVALSKYGVKPQGFLHDTMLYAFLLTADPGSSTLEIAATRYLDRKPAPAVEDTAACIWQLARRLSPEVEERGLRSLYDRIDLPLAPVLARMECNGIRIDPAALRALGGKMETEIDRLCGQICALAGHTFNPNSPQQLAKVLFEEMKLPSPTVRGKGKTMSTAAEVLEGLAEEHTIARLVLEYRQLTKLKGTYVDALPALLDPATGRLHTTFNPAGAATGRLSSSNPNLQNIPIRTELGREIRAAFIPEPGWKLVVADYSQIELRLLAHFSRDPVLLDAFQHGEDIHTRTAAEVFGVMPLMVTPDLRRAAKAVNFGIVYGLSPFGLAQQLGITRTEAETYIRNYFERYAGVRRFIDSTIAEVRRTGVTKTLFGRERPIPDMNSRNPNARGFAERTAVNTPLQGAAADLIKLAMIRIDAHLQRDAWRSRLLLQVHDELVLEAPPDEIERLSEMVRRELESAAKLDAPLVAETCAGPNWRDAK
jgi:DNA polymerase-1